MTNFPPTADADFSARRFNLIHSDYTRMGLANNVRRWFAGFSLGRKIATGYGLALGIAVVGTLSGLWIGEIRKQSAQVWRQEVHTELELLEALELELLQSQLHQRQFGAFTSDIDALQQEYSELLKHVVAADHHWTRLRARYREDSTYQRRASLGEANAIFDDLQLQYSMTLVNYRDQVTILITPVLLSDQVATDAQRQAVLDFGSTQLVEEMYTFFQQVEQLKAVASQEFDAVDEAFVQSERVRMAILLGSMVVSAAISILCAILTTKAIVKPLQRTTTVAKQVVEEADFDLQAPVTTGDAVGELTKALNELIRSVKALLLAKEHSKIQLVQAEKMSSLGQMVAGLAHEINNPVNFISTNLEPAKEHTQGLLTLIAAYQSSGVQPQGLPPELDADEIDFMLEDLPKILDSMTMGTHRITDIVQSLKGFSRKDDSTLKPSDLHEGIENTLLILGHQLKADGDFQGVEVIKDYGDLPLVDCFPGQINQVIMNILANAIDALKSAADTIEQPTIWIQTDVLGSGWVQLRLRDNGTGIESAVLSKLFEPFFTTKPEGKGTGLGLSISHQIIVEKHGGKLVCDSVLGEGTEFVIEIPLNLSLQE